MGFRLLGRVIGRPAWSDAAAWRSVAVWILVLATTGVAVVRGQALAQRIVEIRVHGNQQLSDAEVVELTGVAVGDPVDADVVAAVARRLEESGRFQSVEVRTRYRSLTVTGDVALVIVVREAALATVSNPVARALASLGRQALVLPVLDYSEGYGVAYGARVGLVGLLGRDSRLSVPATWGGTRQIAVEIERTLSGGVVDRLLGGVSRFRRENPHFEINDTRTRVWGRAERRLPRQLSVWAEGDVSDVRFDRFDDRLTRVRVGVDLDTRKTRSFPRDAVVAFGSCEWLDPSGTDELIRRVRTGGELYTGLVGQSVLVTRASYTAADRSLPPYEQSLLGGGASLRGWRVGAFAGDRIVRGSAELRVPLGSPLSVARLGATVFYDTGTAYQVGQSVSQARFRHGAGVGVFVLAPVVRVQVDVAHNLAGRARVHVAAALSF